MKDLAAHIPAVLHQHGYDDEAQAVRELYLAVLRLKSAVPRPLSVEEIWAGGHALQSLDFDEREKIGVEKLAEMEDWLARLADRYDRLVGGWSELEEHFKSGGDSQADVSGEHGALATLLGDLL